MRLGCLQEDALRCCLEDGFFLPNRLPQQTWIFTPNLLNNLIFLAKPKRRHELVSKKSVPRCCLALLSQQEPTVLVCEHWPATVPTSTTTENEFRRMLGSGSCPCPEAPYVRRKRASERVEAFASQSVADPLQSLTARLDLGCIEYGSNLWRLALVDIATAIFLHGAI